jgi:hypothetical protein
MTNTRESSTRGIDHRDSGDRRASGKPESAFNRLERISNRHFGNDNRFGGFLASIYRKAVRFQTGKWYTEILSFGLREGFVMYKRGRNRTQRMVTVWPGPEQQDLLRMQWSPGPPNRAIIPLATRETHYAATFATTIVMSSCCGADPAKACTSRIIVSLISSAERCPVSMRERRAMSLSSP